MSDTEHSMWSGLGQRAGAAPASPPAGDDDHDDFERESVQRTIPAAGAASVIPDGAVVSPFFLPFRLSAGSADDSAADSAATPNKKEPRMSDQPTGAPRAVRNVQLRICRAIEAAGGSILRADLAKVLPDLDTKQISQGIFQVTANSRAQKHMTDAGWTVRLTRDGSTWLKQQGTSEADAAAPPKKPTRRKAAAPANAKRVPKVARKKPKTRRAAVRVHQPAAPARTVSKQLALSEPASIQVVQERSFRCAVFSDGAFHLAKNGQAIDLTAAEFAEALRYVERMAEQPTA